MLINKVKFFTALITLLLLFFFTAQTVHADLTFGPNIRVSDIPPVGQSNYDGPPILDIDMGNNVDVAWLTNSSGSIGIYYSRLTGGSSDFTDNKLLSETLKQKTFPQIETDSNNIYVAWGVSSASQNFAEMGIHFRKSTDNGQTFSTPLLLNGRDANLFSMVAHDGKILIAYSIQSKEIWLARSSDGGNTFTETKVSEGISSDALRPAVEFRGDNVYVFWYDTRNGPGDIFFARSQDGGATFSGNKSIYTHPNSAIVQSGHSTGRISEKISSNGTIYLAFDFYIRPGDNSTLNSDVFFLKSTNGGDSFSPAIKLSDEPSGSNTQQEGPSLAILPDGSPAIAWLDWRDGGRKAMFVYSQDQGETFTTNVAINNTGQNFNVASQPTITSDASGNIHFVRLDGILSPVGVYYTKIGLGLNPVPTPSPTPDPAPAPFLDLPWDYQGKGQTFNEAAMGIGSYFDHEYPTLSAGLLEPTQLLDFFGVRSNSEPYSSHDGYDYARQASVNLGDSVIAAGEGCASYVQYLQQPGDLEPNNVIKIDHGNGYQTRYLHLRKTGLVTQSTVCVPVQKGQKIGEVGFSGHTEPKGKDGAHIHFMVIEDKNHDGNFEDNIPDGVTDPFGWQSSEPDPWPAYQFDYAGQARTGNKSYYLWTKKLANLNPNLDANGGVFQTERYKLEFPANATDKQLKLEIKSEPFVKLSNFIQSLGSTLGVGAKDSNGITVEHFQNPYALTVSYGGLDISSYAINTAAIYSSQDGQNWTKENTTLNPGDKTATATLDHFTHFALMAERLDTQAPTTTATLSGTMGKPSWYRSNVSATLNATDNLLGTDYTLFKVDGGPWSKYQTPLTFSTGGNHKIQFFSVDKDGNEEQVKTVEFNIDKSAPEAKIYVDQDKKDLVVKGTEDTDTVTILNGKNLQKAYSITDLAGNTVKLDVRDVDLKKLDSFKLYSLTYNQNQPIVQPANSYTVLYSGKPTKQNVKEQYFKLKNVIRARITYDKAKDKSTIYTWQGNSLKQKEIRNGLVLLQLKTNQGNLDYSY